MYTAQTLVDHLLELKEKHGTLDVPIFGYLEDKHPIVYVDVFTDGVDEHLHSIDLNLSIS
jgi:hypothetical protein